MIAINVKADIRQAQKMLRLLNGSAVHKAAARALNDTITTVRAEGAREIKSAHPALKIGDIKRNMTVSKAYTNKLTAKVETKGKPLSLKLYGANMTKRGVTAKLGTKRGPVKYKGRPAFVVLSFAGEIFVRRNEKGRRIRRFRGPSLPGVFRAQLGKFQAIAAKRWKVAFANRLKYEIAKAEAAAANAP